VIPLAARAQPKEDRIQIVEEMKRKEKINGRRKE